MEEDEQGGGSSRLWSRVLDCCPCTSRRWRIDDSGASAPILHPPTGNLAECLIPPSVPGLYGESSSEELPRAKDSIFQRGVLLKVIVLKKGGIKSPALRTLNEFVANHNAPRFKAIFWNDLLRHGIF